MQTPSLPSPLTIPAIVVAGTHSGAGKTSIALGLMGAFRRRGLRVQPFKVGPDFIDPGHHDRAAGHPSRNLDSWMLSPEVCRHLFQRAAADCDLAIVEGVMGLFDGSGATGAGSTAELANLLGAPTILVVDGRGLSRSAAALVAGYAGFDRDLTLAGVIVNRVGSDRHGQIVAEALAAGPVPSLGWLPRCDEFAIASRHLGLHLAAEADGGAAHLAALAVAVETHLDLDHLLALAGSTVPRAPAAIAPRLDGVDTGSGAPRDQPAAPPVRIGIARDRAFCFYYRDSLDLLAAAGAELVPFSPLDDRALPPNLSGLYLGGGYPELHGPAIAHNCPMREAIAAVCHSDRPVYAECGGLMYLSQSIELRHPDGSTGDRIPGVGVLPFRTRMERRPVLGYADAIAIDEGGWWPAGAHIRGHRFHYSRIVWDDDPATCAIVYRTIDSRGTERTEGYRVGNTIASYLHLHFGSNPAFADQFVAACRRAIAPVNMPLV